jgi:hypothetical protein
VRLAHQDGHTLCDAPGCAALTTGGKQFCEVHVTRMPYVAALLEENAILTHECQACGEEFEASRETHKFCSRQCYMAVLLLISGQAYRKPAKDCGPRVVNEAGRRYGKWTVMRRAETPKGGRPVRWVCRCDCGRVKAVIGQSLRSKQSSSCASCAAKERMAKKRRADLKRRQAS